MNRSSGKNRQYYFFPTQVCIYLYAHFNKYGGMKTQMFQAIFTSVI